MHDPTSFSGFFFSLDPGNEVGFPLEFSKKKDFSELVTQSKLYYFAFSN